MTLFNRITTISQASRKLGPCSAQPKTPIDCFGAAWAGLDTKSVLNLNVKFLASKSRSHSAYGSGMHLGYMSGGQKPCFGSRSGASRARHQSVVVTASKVI